MPEVKIDKLTTAKDRVYFPGTANLSDKDAEAFAKPAEKPVAEVVEGEAAAEVPKAKKGK